MDYTLALVREKLAPAYRANQIWVDNFFYSVVWNPLTASVVNDPRQLGIDADADFLIQSTSITAYSAPGTRVADPDYEVTVLDTGSGRQFQNTPVHIRNFAGTAERPMVWSEPKLIAAASTLNFQLTNKSTQAAVVQITLHGQKIFFFTGFSRAQLGLVGFGV